MGCEVDRLALDPHCAPQKFWIPDLFQSLLQNSRQQLVGRAEESDGSRIAGACQGALALVDLHRISGAFRALPVKEAVGALPTRRGQLSKRVSVCAATTEYKTLCKP